MNSRIQQNQTSISNNNRQFYMIKRGQNNPFQNSVGGVGGISFMQQLPLGSTNQTFNTSGVNNANNLPHLIHHHHHSRNNPQFHNFHKANLYRVPSLFQDTYKVPMHFRNVYYYKSLLNLNMRLMVLRPHGAGALTIVHKTQNNANSGVLGGNLTHSGTQDDQNISISCPDLQLKQVFTIFFIKIEYSFEKILFYNIPLLISLLIKIV